MKKTRRWSIFVVLAAWSLGTIACASSQPKKLQLDPLSQKFLDYVSYIIMPVEEKIFREMPPEDRGEFIRDFWARRDPDPSTPINEFRQTFYTRLAIADKAFKVGKPGWRTDRGRIYILLGPPTNVISKSMGDVPYEQNKFVKANPLETGTITERATEIWVYDNYPEYFAGPLRLVFVDYYGTGDYKLQTKNVAAEVTSSPEGPLAQVKVDIPFARLDYKKEGEKYIYDLSVAVEIRDKEKNIITRQEEEIRDSLPWERLKSNITNQLTIHRTWSLDLPPKSHFIYISVTDKVRGKRLRKLLTVSLK